MLTAITRAVSRSLAECELTWLERVPIDVALAMRQHDAYAQALERQGLRVLRMPAEDGLPDAVFVEDPLLVLDEVAVALRMGAVSRRAEVDSLLPVIGEYRDVIRMQPPGTIDGGDIVRIGRQLFVGQSSRSDAPGTAQLAAIVAGFGYTVVPVAVRGCLHLKSGCTSLGDRVLLNAGWIDASPFQSFHPLHVPASEPAAADVLTLPHTLLLPASFPATAELLRATGHSVTTVDVSELQKAEAGVTCMSVLFDAS